MDTCGNPQFLAVLDRLITAERELMGLNPPKEVKTDVNATVTHGIDWAAVADAAKLAADAGAEAEAAGNRGDGADVATPTFKIYLKKAKRFWCKSRKRLLALRARASLPISVCLVVT